MALIPHNDLIDVTRNASLIVCSTLTSGTDKLWTVTAGDKCLGTIHLTLLGMEAFRWACRFSHSSEGVPRFHQSFKGAPWFQQMLIIPPKWNSWNKAIEHIGWIVCIKGLKRKLLRGEVVTRVCQSLERLPRFCPSVGGGGHKLGGQKLKNFHP